MLKSQDILVSLQLLLSEQAGQRCTYASLAQACHLSVSETHAAVRRAHGAGLLLKSDLGSAPSGFAFRAARSNLGEFLQHAIKYVWPAQRGKITRGVPTGMSYPALRARLNLADNGVLQVWPSEKGSARGESIAPLSPSAPECAVENPALHEWLALVDLARMPGGRAHGLALTEIRKRLE